jgi:UDP-N-acetyl-2-amino-2-deoxyglucuronate dehydrogenase
MIKKVGIIGCGKILPRHMMAIEQNDDFVLQALCDINETILDDISKAYKVPHYVDYKEMIQKEDLNFVVIATPNSLHYPQAKYCLENGCDVLIEKPATLNPDLSKEIKLIANKNNQKAYAVLQVRLNPVVLKTKCLLDNGFFGAVRGVSLTQRWQRPEEYFLDWRGNPGIGGGTLHECGIHYLDILCHMFGKPKVVSSKLYNTKHTKTTIEDTIYSILDFSDFGGTVEVTISTEPKNIECSMAIITEFGFIKLGGSALNEVVEAKFLDNEFNTKSKYDKIMTEILGVRSANSYGTYSGSCPNHPELYANLDAFDISITIEVLDLIKDIYEKCGVEYSEK